jgi:hypothetical protein
VAGRQTTDKVLFVFVSACLLGDPKIQKKKKKGKKNKR